MILGPKIDTVNYENRNLAEKPVFSFAEVDSYPSDYEDYYNDNFPFRSKLITLNSRISYQILGEGVGSAVVGKDGWLFLGSKDAIDTYTNSILFTQDELKQITAYLNSINDYCEKNGKKF
jgi:hypothetical protein